jgi:hypothetical protein
MAPLFSRTKKEPAGIHPKVIEALKAHVAGLHGIEDLNHVDVRDGVGVSAVVRHGVGSKILHHDFPKTREYKEALSNNPKKAIKLLPKEPSDIGFSNARLSRRWRNVAQKAAEIKEPDDTVSAKTLYKPLVLKEDFVDIFVVYQFLKKLVTPFDQTKAFKLGLIDKNGKRLKKPSTEDEKNALTYFDKLVFNLKRLLALVPGGSSQLASYAAALLLLREEDARLIEDSEYLVSEFRRELHNIDPEEFAMIQEEIANVAGNGAGVVGTGGANNGRDAWRLNLGVKKRGGRKLYGQPIMFRRK